MRSQKERMEQSQSEDDSDAYACFSHGHQIICLYVLPLRNVMELQVDFMLETEFPDHSAAAS